MKILASDVSLRSQNQSTRIHQKSTTSGIRISSSVFSPKETDNSGVHVSLTDDAAQEALTSSHEHSALEENTSSARMQQAYSQQAAYSKSTSTVTSGDYTVQTADTIKLLRKLMLMLAQMSDPAAAARLKKIIDKLEKSEEDTQKSLQQSASASSTLLETGAFISGGTSLSSGSTDSSASMTSVSQTYQLDAEYENFSFQGSGAALTEDGRTINFDTELSMSRSFMQRTFTYEETGGNSIAQQILADPLVINVSADTADIGTQKFYFDIDSDGKQESLSGLSKGSGFLALDKNENGKIDDGSELFGTKSGDGFADLAAYDEDGNGWIDENDSVFSHLKIWYQNGNDAPVLMSLKSQNVGALYLGNARTQFSLKDSVTGDLAARIQKTGVYLKENGQVGTLQHVDLAL